MSDRPIILTILAILAILAGLVLVATGAIAYTMSEETWFRLITEEPEILETVKSLSDMHSIGLPLLISGILMLIIGIALFVGWSLAWYVAVILLVVALVINVYTLVTGGLHSNTYGGLLGIAIEVIIVAYLMTPKVRGHFGV